MTAFLNTDAGITTILQRENPPSPTLLHDQLSMLRSVKAKTSPKRRKAKAINRRKIQQARAQDVARRRKLKRGQK